MPSRLTEVIFDGHDIVRLADFWCAALGYERVPGGDGWIGIGPGALPTKSDLTTGPVPTQLSFSAVPEAKAGKNRLHIDLTPVGTTQSDEVERLIGLGAVRADVGQSDVSWVVLADPEGNEFCVLTEVTDERT